MCNSLNLIVFNEKCNFCEQHDANCGIYRNNEIYFFLFEKIKVQSTLDFRNLQIVKFLDLVKFLLLTKFLLNKTLEIVKFLFIFESPIFRFSKVFLAKLMKFSDFLMKIDEIPQEMLILAPKLGDIQIQFHS